MSVNKYKPHVWVIPEDDANRQLVNGFLQYHSVDVRAIGVDTPAGGWGSVLEVFETQFLHYLRKWPCSYVVMLIDFDQKAESRRSKCEERIPEDLKSRVFVLGSKENPEQLRKEMKTGFDKIGEGLAEDSLREDCGRWTNPHLSHNREELLRMVNTIKPIIFPGR